MTPRGPQNSYDLLVGDYLRIAVRPPGLSWGTDAGFARIERVEHLAEALAREVFTHRMAGIGPAPVVWCQGVPGPLVLSDGDVQVLDHTSPERMDHDEARPWWPHNERLLLLGGVAAGDQPHRWRREPRPLSGHVTWANAESPRRAARRATAFTKPAEALLVGDYLRIHRDRWPECDQEVDEGYSRIEHIRLINSDLTQRMFDDPAWYGPVIVVSTYGLNGVLVLRAQDAIEVQASPSPERMAWEIRNQWAHSPSPVFKGSRVPTDDEDQTARTVDAARRPQVDETHWYPSQYSDHFQRRLALESHYGLRMVPLSALPWPHFQAACRMGRIAETYEAAVDDEQTAHAAAFLSPEGRDCMSSCRYHQPDWPRLVHMLTEILDNGDGQYPEPQQHPDYAQLSARDQEWLLSLLNAPIEWDDRDQMLTNGQHRLCALRAAGVLSCPVRGRHLPDTDHGQPIPADNHARATIQATWRKHAAQRWPHWIGHLIDKLSSMIKMRRITRGRCDHQSRSA